MKLAIYIIAFMAIVLSGSCNSNFTCECFSDDDKTPILPFSKYNLTKADATSACENADKKEGQYCVLTKN